MLCHGTEILNAIFGTVGERITTCNRRGATSAFLFIDDRKDGGLTSSFKDQLKCSAKKKIVASNLAELVSSSYCMPYEICFEMNKLL